MRPRILLVTLLLVIGLPGWGETPEANSADALPTFRVTTAEVHVTFTVARGHHQVVADLAPSDFTLLRDGEPVNEIVSFTPYHQVPIFALVLTDVSDSMTKGLAMERAATDWLHTNANSTDDRISFLDFGAEPGPVNGGKTAINQHVTSLYDSLIDSLSKFANRWRGRKTLILLTDGADNYSYYSLQDVIDLAQRSDIAIYAITAHPGKKQYYRPDLLAKLCEDTGGKYYDVQRVDAMLNAVAEISDELRNGYEVVFRPGARSAGMHQLSLRATQPGLRFSYRSAYFQQPADGAELASTR